MKRIIASTSALALLAACGSTEDEAPAPAEAAQATPVGPEAAADPQGEAVHILAFGDSLFAGYGVEAGQSYPAQLEAALRARGINANIANAGVSGDTTQAGRDRLAFTIDGQPHKPDLVIIELGGNDLLRSIPPEQTRSNLRRMLEIAREKDVPAILFGMRAPPNYGTEYQQRFDALQYDAIYRELADQYDVPLVPFFLESIYRDPGNFQSDRIHPTATAIGTLVEDTADEVVAAIPEQATATAE